MKLLSRLVNLLINLHGPTLTIRSFDVSVSRTHTSHITDDFGGNKYMICIGVKMQLKF